LNPFRSRKHGANTALKLAPDIDRRLFAAALAFGHHLFDGRLQADFRLRPVPQDPAPRGFDRPL
jgi:hypothetical protein